MKAKLLFLVCYVFSVFHCLSQVSIPDSRFLTILINKYPECFDSTTMDTLCAATKQGKLDVSNSDIQSLEGIQYFKSLNRLVCSDNKLSTLPSLPDSLTTFSCGGNQLTNLPTLPAGLIELSCSMNKISSLPSLPNTLTYINVGGNDLVHLPALPLNLVNLICNINKLKDLPSLPNLLRELVCAYNPINSLPPLPESLIELSCTNNLLTSLPALPKRTMQIICDYNMLTSLPALPDSLNMLQCSNNDLSTLPPLPKVLHWLNCTDNRLTHLPILPERMTVLYTGNNQLKTLPPLPVGLNAFTCGHNLFDSMPELPLRLNVFGCGHNFLKHLPALPPTLEELYCDSNFALQCMPFLPAGLKILRTNSTGIRCLPNIPTAITKSILPVCNPINNSNECQSFPYVTGVVFLDENKNGIKDPSEIARKGLKVISMPGHGFTFTNDTGYYQLALDSLASYTLAINNPKFWTSSSQTVNPSFMGQLLVKNFALQQTKLVKDLSATLTILTPARPGFKASLLLEVENLGNTTENGTAFVEFPNQFSVDSTSAHGTGALLNFNQLRPGQKLNLLVYGRISTSAILGDTLIFKGVVNVGDKYTDSAYNNNISTSKLVVRGSFDPNDKEGPSFISKVQVENNEPIEYLIRFQNTGTDTAFTVVVADKLSDYLVPGTVELIGTSHICRTSIKGSTMFFEFINIRLPDNKTNESQSHGFIRYRVIPKNTLISGQSIDNTAAIYFDYNLPIYTNTVTTTVKQVLVTGTANSKGTEKALQIFPNPITGGFLSIPSVEKGSFKLSNSQGQTVEEGAFSENMMHIGQVKPGIYLLDIFHNNYHSFEKVTVW
ncbi:MAG: hypothetical protein H7329_14755 [Opitutaceae bacterium]|nr:hypothetical protein [Cytophagales bacterium]